MLMMTMMILIVMMIMMVIIIITIVMEATAFFAGSLNKFHWYEGVNRVNCLTYKWIYIRRS